MAAEPRGRPDASLLLPGVSWEPRSDPCNRKGITLLWDSHFPFPI